MWAQDWCGAFVTCIFFHAHQDIWHEHVYCVFHRARNAVFNIIPWGAYAERWFSILYPLNSSFIAHEFRFKGRERYILILTKARAFLWNDQIKMCTLSTASSSGGETEGSFFFVSVTQPSMKNSRNNGPTRIAREIKFGLKEEKQQFCYKTTQSAISCLTLDELAKIKFPHWRHDEQCSIL